MVELLKYIGSDIKLNLKKKKISINNKKKTLKTLAPYNFFYTRTKSNYRKTNKFVY